MWWKWLIAAPLALVALVVIHGMGERVGERRVQGQAETSRRYVECTDVVDREYQAKLDAEFEAEKRAWSAKYGSEATLTVPKLQPVERSDYFIKRRGTCTDPTR
jgi:hypothetical protein